jgi:hypothetical protein
MTGAVASPPFTTPDVLNGPPRKLLLFFPAAKITLMYNTVILVGRILADLGHTVHVGFCNALYERCVVMDCDAVSHDVPRGQVFALCGVCRDAASRTITHYGLEAVDLWPTAYWPFVHEATRLVDAADDSELLSLTTSGIDFGALCSQDLVLMRKNLLNEALKRPDALLMRQYLRTSIATYLGMRQFLANNKYTDVLTMNFYSSVAAGLFAARDEGLNWSVVTLPMHVGHDQRRMIFTSKNPQELGYSYIDAWPSWRDTPLLPEEVEMVGDDVLFRLTGTGSHIYSPAVTRPDFVLGALGLPASRKLIVAFTSSLDERQANAAAYKGWGLTGRRREALPFPDQMAWLNFLIEWVGARHDVQLVIRIHPREDSNKRESVRSRHMAHLEQLLANVPANVRVVWPRDPISSYDLIEAADLVQTSWSTIGLESARLGVPTMTCDGFNTYPVGDFILGAETPAAFGQAMERLLEGEPALERLVWASRFYALTRLHAGIAVDDLIPAPDIGGALPPFTRPRNARLVEQAVFSTMSCPDINRQAWPPRTAVTAAAEDEAVRRMMRRLVRFAMTGETDKTDYRLTVTRDRDSGNVIPSDDVLITLDGPWCQFSRGRDKIVRFSPLVARLAPLCGTALTRPVEAAPTYEAAAATS